MSSLLTDIYSVLCVILGLVVTIVNIRYLWKIKKVEKWIEIRILSILSSLYFSVIFALILLGVFPNNVMPPAVGRPGILLAITTMLLSSIYGRIR
jgi:hypothetical protein